MSAVPEDVGKLLTNQMLASIQINKHWYNGSSKDCISFLEGILYSTQHEEKTDSTSNIDPKNHSITLFISRSIICQKADQTIIHQHFQYVLLPPSIKSAIELLLLSDKLTFPEWHKIMQEQLNQMPNVISNTNH